MSMLKYALLILPAMAFLSASGQVTETEAQDGYRFKVVSSIPATPVKDQYKSGTCWSFAATSFIESELLRMGYDTTDISEMYFVYHAYLGKAGRYVRLHGNNGFSPGGQAHDVMNVIKDHGFATEADYPGLIRDEEKHRHGELDAVLKAFLDALVATKDGKLSKAWQDAYTAILDAYLGNPESAVKRSGFSSKQQFPGFNPDDYIELTSYQHHPFYKPFSLEIPDNWSNGQYYNLPVDELCSVIDHALKNNFTVCWDGDVSDKGFSHANGVAIVPDKNLSASDGTERARWEKMTEKERNTELYNFSKPGKEKIITQEMRQEVFDNFQATDDHLMHFTGMAEDQYGTVYYITKNSWAANSNQNGGYLNMSEAYVRLNTIAVMLHKDALPSGIRKKLGL